MSASTAYPPSGRYCPLWPATASPSGSLGEGARNSCVRRPRRLSGSAASFGWATLRPSGRGGGRPPARWPRRAFLPGCRSISLAWCGAFPIRRGAGSIPSWWTAGRGVLDLVDGYAALGMGDFALTAALAGADDGRRARERPWLVVAWGVKAAADAAYALVLTVEQPTRFRRLCGYCPCVTGCALAAVRPVVPEVRDAVRRLRGQRRRSR